MTSTQRPTPPSTPATPFPIEALRRGVDAIDFRAEARPGEPLGLRPLEARPPLDNDALEAMFAAMKLHQLLGTLAMDGGHPAAQAAETLRLEIIETVRGGQSDTALPPMVRRYRTALTEALAEYARGDAQRLVELARYYREDLKAID